MNWAAVGAASGFVTAIIALYLLGQGQRDRRRVREDQRSAQARDVIVRVVEDWEPVDAGAKRFTGAHIDVLNLSDRPIWIEGIDYVIHTNNPDVGPVHVPQVDLEDVDMLTGRTDRRWDWYGQGGFAILRFRDHTGQEWWRRSDDLSLREQPRQIRWWQRAVQWLCRPRPVQALLLGPWMWSAFRSAKKHGPDRTPVGLRVVRFLFGYWPIGEADPWLKPELREALYGYTELYEAAKQSQVPLPPPAG